MMNSLYKPMSRASAGTYFRHLGLNHIAAFVALLVISSPVIALAQDNYEIQVYGCDLVEPKHTMVELHSNFTIDGSKTMADDLYATNHAQHETVEITHGFN